MTFILCEYSAAIGYATCYYENYPDSDLQESLDVALEEFIAPCDRPLDQVTMATLVSHLDGATKEYQLDRDDQDLFEDEKDEDEDRDEDDDEDEDEE